MINDILYALQDELTFTLKRFDNTRRTSYAARRGSEEEPDWQKEGYVLFRFELYISQQQIEFNLHAYDWIYGTPKHGICPADKSQLKDSYNIQSLTPEEKQELFDALYEYANKLVTEETDEIFSPVVEFSLGFVSTTEQEKSYEIPFSKTIMKCNGKQHLQQFHEYVQEMLTGAIAPYTQLENVLWKIWKYEYNESFCDMKPFLEEYYNNLNNGKAFMGREVREKIRWELNHYSNKILSKIGVFYPYDDLKKYYDLTEDQIALLALAGKIIGDYAENQEKIQLSKALNSVVKIAMSSPINS